MVCFVNLPLRWIAHDERWLEWFLAEGVAPELGIDAVSLGLDRSWHQAIAQRLQAAGLPCSVHLPFFDLSPGAEDAELLELSRTRLHQAAELARLYRAAHMVGHPDFIAKRDGRQGGETIPDVGWLARSRESWEPLPRLAEAPLFLENTYERSPRPLLALLEDLGLETTGICLDVGHWNHFAGGGVRQDLPFWVATLAPYLRHLHLHDNDGSADQHLGLGEGNIAFPLLLTALKEGNLSPSVTLEPHTGKDFAIMAAWFAAHPEAGAQLGWSPLRRSELPIPQEL